MELIKRGKYWHYDHKWGSKRLRGSTGKTDKYLASIKAKQIIEEVETRGVILKDNDFGAFVKRYWQHADARDKRDTIVIKRVALNHFMQWKTIPSVSMVTTEDVEAWQTYMVAEKMVKPQTVNSYLKTLRTIFNVALRWGYLSRNPFELVPTLNVKRQDPRAFSKDEIKTILDEARKKYPRYYDLFYFYLLTGMRRAEPMTLEWEDIDYKGGMIRLNPNLVKTHRHVIILPMTEKILKARQEAGEKKPFDIYPDRASLNFALLRKTVDMEWATIKTFRRSTTSYLRSIKVPGIIVDYIMGHSEETALNHYFEVKNEDLMKQIQPLQKLLPKYIPVDPKIYDTIMSQSIKRGIAESRENNKALNSA